MKKILITGASGFLGMSIVSELAEFGGYDIYAVASGRRNVVFPNGVNTVTADLLDRERSKRLIEEIRPEIMVHLAWGLSEPGFLKSVNNLVWLEESLRMLRFFLESGGKYFTFAGSSAEYGSFRGFSENGETANDATDANVANLANVTLYGQCKNSFHRIASNLCGASGIKYVNLRFFPTLGKRVRANVAVPMAIAAFTAGERFVCKSPYNIWDFISVDDASKATCAVIQKQYSGVVNIASGVPRMVGDVFRTIAKKMNCEHLLSLNFENSAKEILVANTDALNNVIGYICSTELDEMLDGMIASISKRT